MESDDETIDIHKKDMDSRRNIDATLLDLVERRVFLKRIEREDTRFVETVKMTMRRLFLDDQRAAVEI